MDASWKPKAIELYQQGLSLRQIAPIVGKTFQRVHQVVRNYSARKHLRKDMAQKFGVNPTTLLGFAHGINSPRIPNGKRVNLFDYTSIEDKIKEHFFRVCPVCGKKFVSDSKHRRYESDECRKVVENSYHKKRNFLLYRNNPAYRQKCLERKKKLQKRGTNDSSSETQGG